MIYGDISVRMGISSWTYYGKNGWLGGHDICIYIYIHNPGEYCVDMISPLINPLW